MIAPGLAVAHNPDVDASAAATDPPLHQDHNETTDKALHHNMTARERGTGRCTFGKIHTRNVEQARTADKTIRHSASRSTIQYSSLARRYGWYAWSVAGNQLRPLMLMPTGQDTRTVSRMILTLELAGGEAQGQDENKRAIGPILTGKNKKQAILCVRAVTARAT